jgi:hypothetical protein
MPKVSDSDRRHFARIASAEEELNRQSLIEDALRRPEENIRRGLELSVFASAFGAVELDDEAVPAIGRWRRRTHRGKA